MIFLILLTVIGVAVIIGTCWLIFETDKGEVTSGRPDAESRQ